MTESKTALQSLTVLSAGAAALVSLAGALGVSVDPALAAQATDGVAQLVSAGLAAVAIYGRLRATSRIRS